VGLVPALLYPLVIWNQTCAGQMDVNNSPPPSPSHSTHAPHRPKALKQLVKLYYRLKQYDKMIESYRSVVPLRQPVYTTVIIRLS
jgi:hypothetical protein